MSMYRTILATHQRDRVRILVEEAKKQGSDPGDGKYRVVGPPGKEKIVKQS